MKKLLNIGQFADVTFSSSSPWSTSADKVDIVSDAQTDRKYCCYTDIEDNPYILLDLLDNYKLWLIEIYNSEEDREDSRSLTIQTSQDGKIYQSIYSSLDCWGDKLTINLNGAACARYIKLTLAERNCLHLKKIKIMSDVGYIEQHDMIHSLISVLDKVKASNANIAFFNIDNCLKKIKLPSDNEKFIIEHKISWLDYFEQCVDNLSLYHQYGDIHNNTLINFEKQGIRLFRINGIQQLSDINLEYFNVNGGIRQTLDNPKVTAHVPATGVKKEGLPFPSRYPKVDWCFCIQRAC